MTNFYIFCAAAALTGLGLWWERRRVRRRAAAPTESLGATLYALGEKIDGFAKKTVHPRELLVSPDFSAAVTLLGKADIDVVRQYALGDHVHLAAAALEALASHPERQKPFDPIVIRFRDMAPPEMHFALRYFTGLAERPPVGGPAMVAQAWWCNNVPVVESFKDYFAERQKLGDAPEFGAYLDWSMASPPAPILNFLSRVEHPYVATLKQEIANWGAYRLDRKFLNSFGRLWEAAADNDVLIAPPHWSPLLELGEKSVLAARSLLISGEPRIGKTTFLKLLAERLKREGWRVFEAGAADLMAGQSYFGELEGRIRQAMTELAVSKRVVWYVGDLLQLAESGTHRGQSASVLDQILPAILDGRLVILAEASPEGLSRLFQLRPSLRTQMEVHKLQPFTPEELSYLAQHAATALADRVAIAIADDAIAAALQLSQQYLGGGNLPGPVMDLIKRAVQHVEAGRESIVTAHSMLAALSQITGLPAAILDDRERVDLAEVRKFFTAHVIGQEEAVAAIVDRIAMLKAGLTDPGRPVGVFLFAGPTGTGKTELAKTLASYLFASPARMARLDMSEFQGADSTTKILGERGYVSTSDPLVERVRKQPFSVILLDEFEKAHPNVWDLFLQIFDDGRLADANGRVADFRHAIIILTSNLGATDHQGAGIGFMPAKGGYGENQVLQAVGRTFRPEFVNRLDKIVVFKPLSRELMRQILHKELALVLERRGLRNREWVVEWEQSALEFLLDKGFSPSMGARPLKRAIDQYLLAPLASTLVEHRFPEGDQFLFVRSNGKAIQVEFVDPDAGPAPPVLPAEPITEMPNVSAASMILQPRGMDEERMALTRLFAELAARLAAPQWQEAKSAALAEATAADIWSDPGRYGIFSRAALFDRVDEAMRTAERLKQRLDTGRIPSREMIARLALQLHLIAAGIDDAAKAAPVDAVLSIEPVLESHADSGAAAEWSRRLADMYRRWAELRHMQMSDLVLPSGASPLLFIGGFGAFGVLSHEAGLHVLEEEGRRLTARVTVVAGPPQEPRPDQAYRVFAELASRADKSLAIVRRYREHPAPLVRDAREGWRSGRLDLVLDGNFDLIGRISGKD